MKALLPQYRLNEPGAGNSTGSLDAANSVCHFGVSISDTTLPFSRAGDANSLIITSCFPTEPSASSALGVGLRFLRVRQASSPMISTATKNTATTLPAIAPALNCFAEW